MLKEMRKKDDRSKKKTTTEIRKKVNEHKGDRENRNARKIERRFEANCQQMKGEQNRQN